MKHRYNYLLADYQAFPPAEVSIFDTNIPVRDRAHLRIAVYAH